MLNIIITGASKGMGKAMAEIFAAQNNTLFICARNEKELEATANEIRKNYSNCTIYTKAVDLSNKQEVLDFAKFCLDIATPNILINNAGQFIPGSIHAEDDETLFKMMTTNLYSAYYLTKALLPKMMKNKSGHIFNVCSVAAIKAYSNGGSYGISKYAMLGFNNNLREELKPYGIKVTAVHPGATYTSSWEGSGLKKSRFLEAEDIAQMVFSCSQLSANAVVEEILIRPQEGDI